MQRVLEPELLDTLPPTHPDAVHNRRDLRLTNVIMRNHAWFRRVLPRIVRTTDLILEVGAGDGALALSLQRAGFAVDALDLWPRPPGWPAARTWHRFDVRAFDRWQDYAVVIGNLIFHQFSDADLEIIGAKLRSCRAILACEPTRRRLSQKMYASIAPLLGANYVTLHDAHVSIAAGFQQDELPRRFGLSADRWDVRCTQTHLGAYRMIATRRQ